MFPNQTSTVTAHFLNVHLAASKPPHESITWLVQTVATIIFENYREISWVPNSVVVKVNATFKQLFRNIIRINDARWKAANGL